TPSTVIVLTRTSSDVSAKPRSLRGVTLPASFLISTRVLSLVVVHWRRGALARLKRPISAGTSPPSSHRVNAKRFYVATYRSLGTLLLRGTLGRFRDEGIQGPAGRRYRSDKSDAFDADQSESRRRQRF